MRQIDPVAGMVAPWTKTGITGIFRARAKAVLSRTKSESSSIRRLPERSVAVTHCGPNHRQQYATTRNVVIDCLTKVQSGTDVRNIHEDRVLSECSNQIVEQPSGFAL
jgi:hypothetical protein